MSRQRWKRERLEREMSFDGSPPDGGAFVGFMPSRSLTEPRGTDGHGDRDDAPAREPSLWVECPETVTGPALTPAQEALGLRPNMPCGERLPVIYLARAMQSAARVGTPSSSPPMRSGHEPLPRHRR